jgi:hypothetical protein
MKNKRIVILHSNVNGISPAIRDALVKMAAMASVEIEVRARDAIRERPQWEEPLVPTAHYEPRNFQNYEAPGRARHKKGKR